MQSLDSLGAGYFTINKHSPSLDRICIRCHSLSSQEKLLFWNRLGSWNKFKERLVNHSLVLTTDLTDQASNAFLKTLLKDPFTRSKTEFIIGTKRDCIPETLLDSILSKARRDFDKQILAVSTSDSKFVGIGKVWDKLPDNTALFGLVNSGKSSLINAFIKVYKSKEKLATVSIAPATTLGLLSKKINGKNILEVPGIDHPENFIQDWGIKDLKLAIITRKIKTSEFDLKKPCSIFLGGYLRIDVESLQKLKITIYSNSKLYIHKTSRGDEIFKTQAGKLLVPPLESVQSFQLVTEINQEKIDETFGIVGGGWMSFQSLDPVKISIYSPTGKGFIRI